MDGYEPTHERLRAVWIRLSPETRAARIEVARAREVIVKAIRSRSKDESERKAIKRVAQGVHRSTVRGWLRRYRERGLDGLVDHRLSRPSPMPEAVHAAIPRLRRCDPEISSEAIVERIAKDHDFKTSETKVKRVLAAAGLQRPRGASKGAKGVGESRLQLGGMKLLEAAAVETDYVGSLVRAVNAHVEQLPEPAVARGPDVEDRDELGRFLPSYNERLRKGPDDAIGPGFLSVDIKREGMDPNLLQIGQVRPEVIERKLLAVMMSPVLGSGRWDGIRTPRGELLSEICGIAYMPATLDRFTRELKYAGVSSTLWEVHGRLWLAQTSQWGDPKRAAVLYIDGTTKPVWTLLTSQAAPVSSVGRVMPAIETVAFHLGYGVPVWMLSSSGRTPLVKAVPSALRQMETMWGAGSVGRIVVIDAEANSIPFLKALEQGEPARAWVTRLRPGWVKGKRIFNRNNYRAYRDGDRVRSGVADFPDPDGGTFRMRVVELERRTSGELVYLGGSVLLDEAEWKPPKLADLYFDRWPNQEANFRAVNQALDSKQVHGYGKRLVDNISVVTELDELHAKVDRATAHLLRLESKTAARHDDVRACEGELEANRSRLRAVGGEIVGLAQAGKQVTTQLQGLVEEQQELGERLETAAPKLDSKRAKLEKAASQQSKLRTRLERYVARGDELEQRREIFAHDVELDSLFSLLKVGLVLLVTWVLKECLGDARMDAVTFLEHVVPLPARLRKTRTHEIVTFEHNRRDPEVMGLLRAHAEAINAKGLRLKSGRMLRLIVEDPPKPPRPPPPGSRMGSGDRFKR